MVVLVNLEEEETESDANILPYRGRVNDAATDNADVVEDNDGGNPNFNNFSAALGCYPIISQLASLLDLNSLHELSRTCRQFRANLLQYRALLISQTLRCENEETHPGPRLADRLRESHEAWNTFGRGGVKVGRITSGKIGACARDMVGECRNCGRVVCRNCIIKPPPPVLLKGRHRRLCRTCIKAPLEKLTTFTPNEDIKEESSDAFTYPAFARTPCTCADNVWICQPCGQSLRISDTTYTRGWAWRTRYSTCGGMGTGLGEGNEGVECGRGSRCLAAREVEKEIECDAAELAALNAEMEKAELKGREWVGTSYLTQEIVGIGGRVKKKVKKRVLVGHAVKEYEDERVTNNFLGREHSGASRSWCSWCARVVPGRKDTDRARSEPVADDSISSRSSASSGSAMS